MNDRTPLVIETKHNPDSCVIWLHGLGADGYDFEPFIRSLPVNQSAAIRYILPHAPLGPVTINGGMVMPRWFDIHNLTDLSQLDIQGIKQTDKMLHAMINEQTQQGIASDKIIIAGFSQGGAMALYTGLRYPQKLGGVMGLSTFLMTAETLNHEAALVNRDTPIFLAHGERDDVLPFEAGQISNAFLQAQRYPVEWHAYAMGHEVCPEEQLHVNQWLTQRLVG